MTASGDVLFEEPGARWNSLLAIPIMCGIGIIGEMILRGPVHWLGWGVAGTAVGLVFCWQIYAARTYASVSFDGHTLRQGTKTLQVDEIAEILPPESDTTVSNKVADRWLLAPPLGDLPTVPKRRTGIGLVLRSGTVTQAWAKDHETLRTLLAESVVQR
ncbi:hypothetical protein IEU95_16190 [Hoyosella rhizosphaerae]|uniref:DUF3093 domain-containing protein n=1 Tax=Hoyosella rhizosphaerae TaxID=1755582 RepID=A0A916UIS0_9ACTN|nr:hypothetical protein [Hoyosella rhizosphaerae]MBN4928374.1 hypothetical protein [Hoyosella rhizosphaerae]GGC74454.1 hypothetical protein GCM10011410_29690 [Hoyosella rhizosphaerae]